MEWNGTYSAYCRLILHWVTYNEEYSSRCGGYQSKAKKASFSCKQRRTCFRCYGWKDWNLARKKQKRLVFVRYSHNNKLRKRVFFSSEKRKTVDGLNIGVIGWKQPLSQPFLAVIKLKQLNSAANKEENVFGDINLK